MTVGQVDRGPSHHFSPSDHFPSILRISRTGEPQRSTCRQAICLDVFEGKYDGYDPARHQAETGRGGDEVQGSEAMGDEIGWYLRATHYATRTTQRVSRLGVCEAVVWPKRPQCRRACLDANKANEAGVDTPGKRDRGQSSASEPPQNRFVCPRACVVAFESV
jgi:hypothetical protein